MGERSQTSILGAVWSGTNIRPLVIECITGKEFSYFSTKTYVVGNQKTVSMRRLFRAPKKYVKLMGEKIFTILRSKLLFI